MSAATHLEAHLLAKLLSSPVVDVGIRLAFEINLPVASTSRPEDRFPCILASQVDANEKKAEKAERKREREREG